MAKNKAKDKKHNVVYIAFSFDTGQLYIGLKSFNEWKNFYEYQTSSTDNVFRESEKMKHIIADFQTREEAAQLEIDLHDFFDVRNCGSFANLANATSAGFSLGYSERKYHLVHVDGKEEYCPQYEMREKYGLNRDRLSLLCRGEIGQHKGWSLKRNSLEDPWVKRLLDNNEMIFIDINEDVDMSEVVIDICED